mgnify:CR=1 FL=1
MSHTICEVWNENEQRWMLVDPSMDIVDFRRDHFDFSHDAWLQLQNGDIETNLYGNPGKYFGLVSMVGKISHDLASVLGTEYPIYQHAPILDDAFEDNQLSVEHTKTLTTICELMTSLDADNLVKLQDIYNNTPEIQVTKTFNPTGKKAKTAASY